MHEYLLKEGYVPTEAVNIEDFNKVAQVRHASKSHLFAIIAGEFVPEAIEQLKAHKHQYVLYDKKKDS